MRLLDRYLTRELMIPLAYCLVGFLIFWVSFDWLAMAEDFRDAGMKLTVCIYYYCPLSEHEKDQTNTTLPPFLCCNESKEYKIHYYIHASI